MFRKLTFRRYGQSPVQGLYPLSVRQLGKTEYEIYAYVGNAGIFKYSVCLARCCRIVPAVHPAEDAVIKRLHSHADSVDTQTQQTFHIGATLFDYIFRIDLHSELVERPRMSALTQSSKKILKNRKGQHRWGAASYI